MIDLSQNIMESVLAAGMAVIGFFSRVLHADIKQNTKDIADFKTRVAEQYLRRDTIAEIKQIIQVTNKRVDEIYLLLTKKDH